MYQKKNDEGKTNVIAIINLRSTFLLFVFVTAHGSQISLMSGSSMYGSTTEEQRQANEVRRLKRELTEAREQVMSLSSQLSTNVST
jgi:TolA-binding protein